MKGKANKKIFFLLLFVISLKMIKSENDTNNEE